MEINYKSKTYSPDKVVRRYVRGSAKCFLYCEVDAAGRDVLQATLGAREVPESTRDEVHAGRTFCFGWVPWPDNVPPPVPTVKEGKRAFAI